MSKIGKAFENGKAFIPFIVAGDPDTETTVKILLEMIRAGADLIEIGIPFSDPTAEGPVIQSSDVRALQAGFHTEDAFDIVSRVREQSDIPIVFLTYLNPVFQV